MDNIKYGQIVNFVHFLVENSYRYKESLTFIDATAGNGFDTLFLCNLAKDKGTVYAFDIQKEAIERTKILLADNFFNNCILITDSHENVLKYVKEEKIDAVLFNLGYLPNSDKSVTTNYSSSINAIKNIIPFLKPEGRIYISAYISHDGGNEANHIHEFVSSLDKREFNVIEIRVINKQNSPPEIYIIEKN